MADNSGVSGLSEDNLIHLWEIFGQVADGTYDGDGAAFLAGKRDILQHHEKDILTLIGSQPQAIRGSMTWFQLLREAIDTIESGSAVLDTKDVNEWNMPERTPDKIFRSDAPPGQHSLGKGGYRRSMQQKWDK